MGEVGASVYIPDITRRCQGHDGETDFVDTRYSPQQESPRCQMANKRKRDESQAKIETREAQRLMSEEQIMVTQWRDLCGR